MLSAGSGEIEAARLRLVAAKSKKESALEMVKSAQDIHKTAEVITSSARDMTDKAKAMMEAATAMTNTARTNTESAKAMANTANLNMAAAQSQLDTADKEISEAEAMLKRVEEKWEVIDVDDSPKKAEKSSDATTNDNVNGTNQAAADEIIDVDEDIDASDGINLDAEIAAGLQAGNGHSSAAEIAADIIASAVAENFSAQVIEGCGTKSANGIYKRDHAFKGSSHYASFTKKVYSRLVPPSQSPTFALYRKDLYWYLSTWNGHSVTKTLYRTMNKSNTGLPPESGWITIDGESPAPKLRM